MLKKSDLLVLSCFLALGATAYVYQPIGTVAAGQVAARTADQKAEYRRAMEEADQKVAAEVKNHSELMANLEYLTTEIGPRLTGSSQMQEASKWTFKRFQDYGLQAHLENFEIPHAWTRGNDSAQIVSPIQRSIQVRSLGWSQATSGAIEAPVVVFSGRNQEGLEKIKDHIPGAIVLAGEPDVLPPADEVPDNAYDAVITPRKGVPKRNQNGARRRFGLFRQLTALKPAALLLDSGKTDNLFNMGSFSRYNPSEIPMAFLTHEDFSLIYRLSRKGPVSMKIDLEGSFSTGKVPASITVAEIKGGERPEERVVLGAHLDSWDLGQGAVDNGTGAMAVLEAARALKALGWTPRRTITFLLFPGEEQGLVGSAHFVEEHAAEMDKVDAVLVHDTGTGKVISIALEDLWKTAPLMNEIYRPLEEVFDLKPLSTRYFGASDHVPFLRKGVPSFFCIQKPDHYREAHHSQADTFDKVIPEEINEGAALLAAWAWNVSEMPPALPHHQPTESRSR